MLFSHRNDELRDKIRCYLSVSGETLESCSTGLRHYLEHGADLHFEAVAAKTHSLEHDADTIRREIEVDLYAHSLLPDSREDILLLIERLDLMPNQAGDVLRQIHIQCLDLPPFARQGLIELAEAGRTALTLLAQGVELVLQGSPGLADILRQVDDAEHTGDQVEQQLVARIFRSDLPTADKILARDIIYSAGSICDFAQDVGFFLSIFAVKRRE